MNIISGRAYVVFTLDDGIVFKVVENFIKDNNKIVLYSLNPVYEPYEIAISEVKEIWKFINYISAELPEPLLPEDHLLSIVSKLKRNVEKLNLRIKLVNQYMQWKYQGIFQNNKSAWNA